MRPNELIAWDGNIPINEYDKLLKKLKSKRIAFQKTDIDIRFEEDALKALEGENESARWREHRSALKKAKKKAEKLASEIRQLEKDLTGGSLWT